MRKAIVCNRSSTVRGTNSVPSAEKIVGSGQNVTVVPVRRPRPEVRPTTSILPCGLPPLAYSCRWRLPSRSISTIRRSDSALTTLTPTPWSPPDTL